MNRTSRRLITPFLALGLVALGACGGGGSSTNTVPADADVVVRAVDGIAWNQDDYTATAVDGKVKIYVVNDSGIAHDMYVEAGDTPVGDFIDLPKRGSDGALVYDLAPGEYRIVCKIPGHANMDSTLTVTCRRLLRPLRGRQCCWNAVRAGKPGIGGIPLGVQLTVGDLILVNDSGVIFRTLKLGDGGGHDRVDKPIIAGRVSEPGCLLTVGNIEDRHRVSVQREAQELRVGPLGAPLGSDKDHSLVRDRPGTSVDHNRSLFPGYDVSAGRSDVIANSFRHAK